MRNTSANLWNSLGGTQISDLGEKSFLFIFFHLLDIKRVMKVHELPPGVFSKPVAKIAGGLYWDQFDFGDEFRGKFKRGTGEVYGNVYGLGSPRATSRLQQMLKFYHP
ncbi:hypothetical protein Golax_005382 [Gossypium laxum]|uniref:Uncharacterized protein n=1 Tax=Gossypium laxum TaxID=34288 RepID=A0A7J9A0J8_9ROSI|nr:hypothetical protein [Gossypium laxum]